MTSHKSEISRRLKQSFECPAWAMTCLAEFISGRCINMCLDIDCDSCPNSKYFDSKYFENRRRGGVLWFEQDSDEAEDE